MIKTPHSSQTQSLAPDLTPLLDIIFIVMVFLLLTASVKLESLEVELPSSDIKNVSEVHKDSISVNILDHEPYWAINGQEYIDWENFKIALLEETGTSDKKPIIIGADKAANVENLVKLLSFLQENGIPATQLLTEDG
ncbi:MULTISPECIES: ExbD/TolR family protein [Vibrio]|jgi:biopolymer transport protein ExbD|uniref:Biopolymer transporter ExbD n=1 Tax=Vibrio splendidus TaxID=29497 RepID=A0A0N8GWC6_VIBSP|nr:MULTISPECIES: biopolymer transporter ExbD [Vibrio]KPL96033.1 biopolymer transporter ExbD [Vibrio splendidus]KPM00551.1 biopolymer transporter ExbD [Vibrio splendidus]MBB1466181.1 biopolymer transporter ExbD [Vibrio sp. SG41-7]MBE8565314.1 biopolymer transporter ExbD [Vibrio sp. OPT20]MBO7913345.1 biopolymer transporter ExbD [Vibrio sp. G41H]|tara:strand:- start:703 stop:1116 length:414 start_codon:yes stop_codon:yes gene_type:complete